MLKLITCKETKPDKLHTRHDYLKEYKRLQWDIAQVKAGQLLNLIRIVIFIDLLSMVSVSIGLYKILTM